VTAAPARRTCGRCGRIGFHSSHFPDGYVCSTCLHAALSIRGACPGCGTYRALPGLRADRAAICRDCAGISRYFTCLHCDYEGNLAAGRLCHPCAVTWNITQIFGSTSHLSSAMASLAGALAAAPNPAATARWLALRPIRGLLADLVTGRLPLTHQALAARTDWKSTIYLRDLLVTCGALPAADRQLADYEAWVHRRLALLAGHHPHERLLRQFSLWHQLPRMRAKAAAMPLPPSARKYAEQRFIQAENFLTWTATLGCRPADLTQADIDTWHATAAIHQVQAACSFLSWAMAGRHIPACQLPALRFNTGEAITQDGDGRVHISFGNPPAPVPEPFASLLLQLITDRPAATGNWLFAGRNPGQPAAYSTIFTQLRNLGFPMRTARISALRQLVTQAPAPVIAQALGFHYTTTERQHANAGATWNRYPAGDHAR
jgi:hypothetical protein